MCARHTNQSSSIPSPSMNPEGAMEPHLHQGHETVWKTMYWHQVRRMLLALCPEEMIWYCPLHMKSQIHMGQNHVVGHSCAVMEHMCGITCLRRARRISCAPDEKIS